MLMLLCVCTTIYATEGALKGAFTINAKGDKVQFSKGNLQYRGDIDTWQFAESQWETLPTPTAGDLYENDYWKDTFSGDCYDDFLNNGNQTDLWRLLTIDEWKYIANGRSNAANLRGAATVNSVKGYILLPDAFKKPNGLNFQPGGNASNNIYSEGQWQMMEKAGAVFLPSVVTYYYQRKKQQQVTFTYTLFLNDENKWNNYFSCSYTNQERLYIYQTIHFSTEDGTFDTSTFENNTMYLESPETHETYWLDSYDCCAIRLVQPYDGSEIIPNPTYSISNIPNGWKVNGSTTSGTYEAEEGAEVIFTPTNIPAGKKIKSIKVVKE